MDHVNKRRRPAWVAWADLEAAIGVDFPDVDPQTVFHSVELGDVDYRLRCQLGGGYDLVPEYDLAWTFSGDRTVIPYRLIPQDWDVFDREHGLFRPYPIEVSWRDVLQLLGARPAVPVTIEGVAASTSEPAADREAQCQRRLEAMMGADPQNEGQLDNAGAFADIRALLPGLAKAEFVRAKARAIAAANAPSWKKPGSRGKRRK